MTVLSKKLTLLLFLSLPLSPAFAISFEEAVVAAKENNPELKKSDYDVAAAKTAKFRSLTGFLPKVGYDMNRGDQNYTIGYNPRVKGNLNQDNFTVSQELFNGGATVLEYKKNKNLWKKERADQDAKTQSIILELAKAYCDILRYQKLLTVETENVESYQDLLEYGAKKAEARDATKAELAKSKADLALAISREVSMRSNLTTAQATFSRITGVDANQKFEEIVNDEGELTDLNLDQLVEIGLANNPQAKSASYSHQAAKNATAINVSSLSPSAKLNFQSSKDRQSLYFNNQRQNNNSVFVNFHFPIFNSGVEYFNISQASQVESGEKYNFETVRTKIRQEISRLLNQVINLKANYTSLKEAQYANQIYVDTITTEERFGTKSIIELLIAKRDLHDSKVNAINAEYDRIYSLFELRAMVGGLR